MPTSDPSTMLELAVCWGDDVLHCRHLTHADRFVVGSGEDRPVDFVVPGVEVAREIVLTPGVTALGEISVHVTEVAAEPAPDRGPLWYLEGEHQRWLLGSLAAHAALLAAFALTPPSASALSMSSLEADHLRTKYVVKAPSIEPMELPPEFVPEEKSDGDSGAAERGDSGAMGDTRAPKTTKRYAVKGPKDNQDERLARDVADDLVNNSIIGTVMAAANELAPTSIYGADRALGTDPISALGALIGDTPGANFGFGGLGMAGTGRHGGGTAEGTVGLTRIGTVGAQGKGSYGNVASLSSRVRTTRVPRLIPQKPDVFGSLSKETIRRVIHRQLSKVRYCYEEQLLSRPDLQGRVAVKFVISPTGAVQVAAVAKSTLGHAATEQCIASVMRRLTFPAPQGGGVVIVTYPFLLQQAGN